MSVVGKISTAVLLVLLGVGITVGLGTVAPALAPWSSEGSTDSSVVVTAIERTEEVSLLSAGIEGVTDATETGKLFGREVPWSEKTKYIKYTFNLKMGIDGSAVTIENTGDNAYTLTVPEFKVIGNSEPHFETVVEDNGILSIGTEEVSESEVHNEVLNADELAKYIASYEDLLRDQTEFFYGNIIRAIDPTIEVEFVFSE
ncbi:hypothetical protein [Demequina rhizosphaerae]|uniref:hypothetical protein n=1 Tax=Demequina rhizosphaerae TaxID=1638985 RepID=UPI000A7105C9|nr:hypothetical protein [Demequina rhizosphaerae]